LHGRRSLPAVLQPAKPLTQRYQRQGHDETSNRHAGHASVQALALRDPGWSMNLLNLRFLDRSGFLASLLFDLLLAAFRLSAGVFY